MARVRTTLYLDEALMQRVRVCAARLGTTQSEMIERALKEELGILDRLRARANLKEKDAARLASEIVHEVRADRNDPTP
jgi:hypothetical protein